MGGRDDTFHNDRSFVRDAARLQDDGTPSGGLKGAGNAGENEQDGNPTSNAIGAVGSPAVVQHGGEEPASSEAQLEAQGNGADTSPNAGDR